MKRWKKILVGASLVCGAISGFECLKENVGMIPLVSLIAIIGGVVGTVVVAKHR